MEAIKEAELDWIEEIRQLASDGNWQDYTQQMGGVFCKREDQIIRPLYNPVIEDNQNPDFAPEHPGKAFQQIRENPASTEEFQTSEVKEPNPGLNLGFQEYSGNPLPELQEYTKAQFRDFRKLDSEIPEQPQPATRDSIPLFQHQSGNIRELKTNRYGDETLSRLKGIVSLGVVIISRVHTWTLSQQKRSTRFSLEYCQ